MDIVKIKRKEFEIIAPIGERSYKVKRKDKTFFYKDFANDKEGFLRLLKDVHRFSNTAIDTPKIYILDKKTNKVVMQYIEGSFIIDLLIDSDLQEKIYEMIFEIDWYGRNEKMQLDLRPDQFKYDGKKLYYLPFRYREFDGKDTFSTYYIKYWFYTDELVKYLKDFGLPYDEKRVGNVFQKNKEMALMAVKYYK